MHTMDKKETLEAIQERITGCNLYVESQKLEVVQEYKCKYKFCHSIDSERKR